MFWRLRYSRGLAVAIATSIILIYFYLPVSEYYSPAIPPRPAQWHPVDDLISAAEKDFSSLLSRETHDLASAAAAYRRRRGRHPPPGFDAWFQLAQEYNALIIEDFFDSIYDDIRPLWALPPSQMRRDVRGNDFVLRVRQGSIKPESTFFRVTTWSDLINTISSHLPDMDIAISPLDEPRLTVPWEVMNDYIQKEGQTRKMPPPTEVVSKFSGVIEDENDKTSYETFGWNDSAPYFPHVRLGCPPDSAARKAEVMTDFSKTPVMDLKNMEAHTYHGYNSNYTKSLSVCHQPDLQGLHGALIQPLTVRISTRLFPLFGESKFVTNNDLLFPPVKEWDAADGRFHADGAEESWAKKENVIFWRGVASGGTKKITNWKGFHRYRLVAMMNATQVKRAERWEEAPLNWARPPNNYGLKALSNGNLGDWLEKSADIGFINLECHAQKEPKECEFSGDLFKVLPGMKLSEFYQHKLLADIDGNSFSARFRAYMLSGSLPVKASMYREWFDSRLVPWKHFAPMDNRFTDLYALIEYFLGYQNPDGSSGADTIKGHDEAARNIAEEGQAWAQKVMRREDMKLYTLRILLEYARVIDDKRDVLGFVGDLL